MVHHSRTDKNNPPETELDLIHYDKMLSLSQSAIVRLDDSFQVLTSSPSIRSILGADAQTLHGESYTDFVALEHQDAFRQGIVDSDVVQFDYPLVTKEGHWVWVHHSGEKIIQADMRCYEFMIQVIDSPKRNQDVLAQELTLLRNIVNALPIAIHANDESGKYIFNNLAHAKLLGEIYPNEALGQTQDKQVLLDGQTIITEEQIKLDDDNKRWLNITKMPMNDAQGLAKGVIGITRDITEEKRAKQQLSESETRHRTLLGALPDLMFVVSYDGIITEFRSTPEVETLGIDASVLGKNLNEAGFPKPLVDETQLYLDIGLNTDYVQSFEFGSEKESILDHSKGTYYEARLVRLNDNEVMALVRNITELKRVQEELSRHIDDLTIVRQVNIELAANLNINYVSQLALDAALRLSNAQAGYLVMVEPSGELKRMGVFGMYDFELLDSMLAMSDSLIPRIARANKPELILDVHAVPDYVPMLEKTEAMMIVPLNSNERTVAILVLEARNATRFSYEQFQFLQLITGLIAASLDNAHLYRQTQEQLEELTQLYKEVQHLEQLKTDMIRIASHDLKNPLGSIMNYMEMFRSLTDEKINEKERNYLDKIDLAATKMERITKRILSLERIQQISERQNREMIDLASLVYKSVAENMDFAVRNEQKLKRHLPEKDILIHADPVQLYEALTNLVHNALKYTPRRGAVDVSLEIKDDVAMFRVKDTGYGIPEHLQMRLFEPFYRAKTTETRFIEGTGLGLHLVKNIVERHNGKMIFESVYQEGSTFGFDIPLDIDSSPEI